MNKEDFLKWFDSLPKKEKIIIMAFCGDDTYSIPELRKMNIEELLNPNIFGYSNYEQGLEDVKNYNNEDILYIIDNYNKK